MGRRYRALHFCKEILRYLGLMMIAGAMACAVMAVFNPQILLIAIQNALGGFFSIVLSEAINVLMDIEENTRRSADALENLGARALDTSD